MRFHAGVGLPVVQVDRVYHSDRLAFSWFITTQHYPVVNAAACFIFVYVIHELYVVWPVTFWFVSMEMTIAIPVSTLDRPASSV